MDLAHESYSEGVAEKIRGCFNPCFNGSCSRILGCMRSMGLSIVSILVLMDLAHEFPGLAQATDVEKVSILVLMDLAHESSKIRGVGRSKPCFNPCFNGSCSRIEGRLKAGAAINGSFNPCFNGSCSRMQDRT